KNNNKKWLFLQNERTLTPEELQEKNLVLTEFSPSSKKLTSDFSTICKVLFAYGSFFAQKGMNITEISKKALESTIQTYRVSLPEFVFSHQRAVIESAASDMKKQTQIAVNAILEKTQLILGLWKREISPVLFKKTSQKGSASTPQLFTNALSQLSSLIPEITPDIQTDLQRGLFFRNTISVLNSNKIQALYHPKPPLSSYSPSQKQEDWRLENLQIYLKAIETLFTSQAIESPFLRMGLAKLLCTQTMYNRLVGPLTLSFVYKVGLKPDTKNSEYSFCFQKKGNETIVTDVILTLPLEMPGFVIKTYFQFTVEADLETESCGIHSMICSHMLIQGGGNIIPIREFENITIIEKTSKITK
ncbi:MAG: hypothetical protein WCP39_03750, partial [Chlamydiota bacterium]